MNPSRPDILRRFLSPIGSALLSVSIVVGSLGCAHAGDKRYSFRSDDPEEQAQYERIVTAHGHTYHYETAPNGDSWLVIDDIADSAYKEIDCRFFAWNAQRQRAQNILVHDRKDCAPTTGRTK